jgi:hypothetical protein
MRQRALKGDAMTLAKAIVLAAALIGLSGALYAQQDFMTLAEDANFRESDLNGDGMLDAQEWRFYIGESAS